MLKVILLGIHKTKHMTSSIGAEDVIILWMSSGLNAYLPSNNPSNQIINLFFLAGGPGWCEQWNGWQRLLITWSLPANKNTGIHQWARDIFYIGVYFLIGRVGVNKIKGWLYVKQTLSRDFFYTYQGKVNRPEIIRNWPVLAFRMH